MENIPLDPRQIAEEARTAADELRDQAQTTAAKVRDHATDTLARGDRYVREQPWPAIAGAFAVGLVLGIVLFRRAPEPSVLEQTGSRLESLLAGLTDRLPSKKQIQAMAPEIPKMPFLETLGKKLNVW